MNKSNDPVDSQVRTLLQGQGLQEDNIFCDFTLTDQNEALGQLQEAVSNFEFAELKACGMFLQLKLQAKLNKTKH